MLLYLAWKGLKTYKAGLMSSYIFPTSSELVERLTLWRAFVSRNLYLMEGMSFSGRALFCSDQALVTFVKQKETGQPSAVGSGDEKGLLFLLEGKGAEVVTAMVNLLGQWTITQSETLVLWSYSVTSELSQCNSCTVLARIPDLAHISISLKRRMRVSGWKETPKCAVLPSTVQLMELCFGGMVTYNAVT